MPLSADSPTPLHVLQNASLIWLSLLFFSLCTFIAVASTLISPFLSTTQHINRHRQWRAKSSSTFRPRTILVTGVGMAKGLAIARAFYKAGHRVIGADFEPNGVPVSGRFSRSLARFYSLPKPSAESGSDEYIEALIDVIKLEKVELWVSCSGVASAVQDGEAKEAVEEATKCKAVQFGVDLTETLHEKHSFIENTRRIGLNVPETYLITSLEEGMEFLYRRHRAERRDSEKDGRQYIMKSVGVDDSIRADMTLLPCQTSEQTRDFISRLRPSPTRPFVLQQFIKGPEYCTHSIVIRGQVKAFTACPSAELLMHYKALSLTSELFKAMLRYTQAYAEEMGEQMTGHFSMDFLLDEEQLEGDLTKKIYPIECNPRAHTAVVLFANEAEAMAEAYLKLLTDYEPNGISNGIKSDKIVSPSTAVGYYWIGHDLVTRAILPIYDFLIWKSSINELLVSWLEFVEHVLFWKEGTFEIWDPWPAWWLYCVYWPGMFVAAILTQRWWSRCNVSTTKMFAC